MSDLKAIRANAIQIKGVLTGILKKIAVYLSRYRGVVALVVVVITLGITIVRLRSQLGTLPLTQTLLDNIHAMAHYWFLILVGFVMPFSDLIKWGHPEPEKFVLPHWLRVGIAVGLLVVAQFLAYKDQAKNLATVIEEKRPAIIAKNALAAKSTQETASREPKPLKHPKQIDSTSHPAAQLPAGSPQPPPTAPVAQAPQSAYAEVDGALSDLEGLNSAWTQSVLMAVGGRSTPPGIEDSLRVLDEETTERWKSRVKPQVATAHSDAVAHMKTSGKKQLTPNEIKQDAAQYAEAIKAPMLGLLWRIYLLTI
jgi:hypothetical protein